MNAAPKLIDGVRRLAVEYAQRANYVEHSNPRAAALYVGIAARLKELITAHAATDESKHATEAHKDA